MAATKDGGQLQEAMRRAADDEVDAFRPRAHQKPGRPVFGKSDAQIADAAEPLEAKAGPLMEPLTVRVTADPPEETLEALIARRAATHGDFTDTARVAQQFKNVMRNAPRWPITHDYQREALDMMAQKFARILTGDPMEKDHWADLQGYARMVEKRL